MTKWALITGAARRIGRATALELAKAGWNIVVHYNRSHEEAEKLVQEIQALGRKAILAEIDLIHLKLAENLIPSIIGETGPLAALVNNASLFELDKNDPDGSRHMTINAEAPRLLGEAFREQVPVDQTGVIINLLDSCTPKRGFLAYIRSKQTLETMNSDMARRYGPRIRVNGVAPGPVLPGHRESAAHFQRLVEETPLRAQVSPENVAATVRFLIENSSITGEVIHVDSGAHLII